MVQCKDCKYFGVKHYEQNPTVGTCNWENKEAIPLSWKFSLPGTIFVTAVKEHDCECHATIE